MSLLEKLPKEIKKDEFDGFIKKIKSDLPTSEFPELFIHYQEIGNNFLVLAIGKSNDCAEQMVKAFKENPNLKAKRGSSKMLRAPKTKFLLRRASLWR